MALLAAIARLLEVLNTPVKGALFKQFISDHALSGPDDRGYWENSRRGISIRSEDGVVTTIFLHGSGKDGFTQFSGPLPAGLTFSAKQADLRRALGESKASRGPSRAESHGGFDRYEIGPYQIHFDYRADDGRIDLVTLERELDRQTSIEASRLEMRATLVSARDTQALVRVHRTVQPGFSDGYVVDVGPQWLILCRVADLIIFDGFETVRFKDVSSVEAPAPHAGFVERALRLRKQTRPRDPKIDLADIAAVLRTASASYPLITLHRELVDSDVCHVGSVKGLAGGTVVLRLISPDGEWLEEHESFDLEEITRVDFGGLYEDALSLATPSD